MAKDKNVAKEAEQEAEQEAKQEAAAGDGQQFAIQRIYIRDLSVETPSSPEIFRENWQQPKIDLSLNTNSKKVIDDVHEVTIKATVTAKLGDKTAYLVEAEQAGVFTIKNFPEETVNQMIGSYCPNILFPYLRETVSDVIVRAGFPQLALSPVNFDAVFAQAQKMQAEQQTEAEAQS